MKILRCEVILSLTFLTGLVAQPLGRPAFLQWSRTTIITSPDKQAQIEVHPILTDSENHSPVVVRRVADQREWSLFTLSRTAEVEWSPNSDRILVIDQPTADSYVVRLFSSQGERTEIDTDRMIRSAAANLVGAKRAMEFYLPTFVAWNAHELVLAVGGTSSHGINKPMAPYCFAVSVDDNSGKILATLSEKVLKSKFNSQCRLNP